MMSSASGDWRVTISTFASCSMGRERSRISPSILMASADLASRGYVGGQFGAGYGSGKDFTLPSGR